MTHWTSGRLLSATRPVAARVLAIALIAACSIWGCASGDSPLSEVDPDAVPDSTSYDQIYSIIQRECLPCHDDGGTAPPYDTCEHVIENFDALFDQVFVKNEMPPGAWPRLSSEERLVLLRWNGEAPCVP